MVGHLLAAAAALLAAAGSAAAQTPAASDTAALLDARADQIVARTVVPSPAQKVGEVRLIRRGDADVVQTLLSTKLLTRVVSEIGKKEFANWPEGRAGHADAARYVAALEAVSRQLHDRQPPFERGRDRRLAMLIEFIASDVAVAVVVGTFHYDERGMQLPVTARTVLLPLDLPRAYVQPNMRLIAADAFQLDGAALESLLAPLPRLHAPTP